MSTEHSRVTEDTKDRGPVVIDGISYIPSSVVLTGIGRLSFKDNSAFGVLNPQGEAPVSYSKASELGLYFNDTRYITTLEMTFNGLPAVALANELRFNGSTLVFSMSNPDLPGITDKKRIPRSTFLIRKFLSFHEDTYFETVAIRNFDIQSHVIQIEQWIGGSFDDVFEVRGYHRLKRGQMLDPSEVSSDEGFRTTVLGYKGLDNQIRKAFIHRYFNSEAIRLTHGMSGHKALLTVPAKGDIEIKTIISFDHPSDGKLHGHPFQQLSVEEMVGHFTKAKHALPFSALTIQTDHAIMNRAIENSKIDIGMLLTNMGDSILYPYAGIPWFSAPFGRDGLITAYQMLPWHPALAKGVLEYAFSLLGSRVDDFTDEQPGKVFHEMRRDEMCNTRELPFIPYFGSVDSTPLALIVLGEYISWTLDLESLKRWWPSALRALEWIEKWGDRDADGFLEYAKQSPTGLVNQGWKDSHNSIMHSDSRLASAPIRLCEAQSYAFRARMSMATLARLLGQEDLANRLRLEALQLKARFTEYFWDPSRKYIYLALDGNSEPCKVMSSNMGHCLWSQILMPDQATAVARHLMSHAFFSGHGIRTLASTEAAYNPMSYHNGSVWPHDNALIMEGFRNYGQLEALDQLSTALIGVLESSSDFRLPELFCGFRKRAKEPPVPYEVACKPQAWAAGSVFLMLKSLMGLGMDADRNHLFFNAPLLTSKINVLEVRNLRGRDWEIDFVLRRARYGSTVEVLRKTGNVRVLTIR